MDYIPRAITPSIEEAYKGYPVITLTGPRQSGKSTLLRHLYPNVPYYSLEDPDINLLAMQNPRGFLDASPVMIIDEVQRMPELLRYIQGIVDSDQNRRFLLSGSSQFAMMRGVTQSLAGRSAVFELLPFSQNEIKPELPLNEELYRGFYPAVWSRPVNPTSYYRDYVKTYIERDVRQLLNVKDLHQFSSFVRLCASRIGSLFNASELANEVGVASNTVAAWLSVLEASYVVFLTRPYSANINKRLIKAPKLYFVDSGLAAYLLDIHSPEVIGRDKMRGHLFENFIVMEAVKRALNQGMDNNTYFYRDSTGNEVDLLVKSQDGLRCVEIKSSQTFHPDFEKGIHSFKRAVREPIASSSVVYAGQIEFPNNEIKLLNYRNLEEAFN